MIHSMQVYIALWFIVVFAWLCIAMQVAHRNRVRREDERWRSPRHGVR